MVLNILDDPSNFQDHTVTYAATTIMKVAYGKNTPTAATDPEVIEVRQVMEILQTVLGSGTYLVDSIPWLKYLPWYGQELKHGYEISKRIHTSQLNRVKQRMQSNVDLGPSFAKFVLENGRHYDLTELEMAFLAGAFFGAGADTVAAAISTVLMAAACFPEEQATVQAELDEVIGRHRAPTFADQESLPRLQAFISEALRWRPLSPDGLDHRTTKDVTWARRKLLHPSGHYGVRQPLASIMIVLAKCERPNCFSLRAISRDPEVYPEPDKFKPQRWMNDEDHLRDDLKFFVFGFGRRVCPAQHVANRSVFITSLLILWAFQLTLDPTKPLDDMGFLNGNPQPFSIEAKTRVPETELRRIMEIYQNP
ncbi:hypothetical protein AZE42_08433 [Rhizopogon vesiculosus]|uniref:Cytochrome P450 n=1 Tax=Rhizopogon vesiculosus TaxID=180088 RepID=A0A1J8PJY8_9AGAM|nr:hypothetical protein AZE42_08433 [Rhizopogon vesiculosus]